MRNIWHYKENELRTKVLIPLLQAMGFQDVIEYHGSNEKGKDIICWKPDDFKGRVYYALVVKNGNIHGSVGKKNSASEVLYQVQQAFSEPYRDVYGLAEIRIHRCIVVTTGKITSTAIDSISGQLNQTNLDRIIDFIDGMKLKRLVRKFLPETHGIIGNIVYTYYPANASYYFYINPKHNPTGGPEVVTTETIQSEGLLINIDYNFDNTVYGFEIIDFREPGVFGAHEITPQEIIAEDLQTHSEDGEGHFALSDSQFCLD